MQVSTIFLNRLLLKAFKKNTYPIVLLVWGTERMSQIANSTKNVLKMHFLHAEMKAYSQLWHSRCKSSSNFYFLLAESPSYERLVKGHA